MLGGKKASGSLITAKELREILSYNPKTGIFRYLKFPSRGLHKEEAGTINSEGYVRIKIRKKAYLAHRLAFIYMKGKWPRYEIDHRNGVRSDNRWENLRAATDLENSRNRKPHKNKAIPVKGVYMVSTNKQRKNPYLAAICLNGRMIHLGVYPTIESASAAYQAAALQHFGKFARIK